MPGSNVGNNMNKVSVGEPADGIPLYRVYKKVFELSSVSRNFLLSYGRSWSFEGFSVAFLILKGGKLIFFN